MPDFRVKLNPALAASIRQAYLSGEATVRELAAMHGVGVETIRRVIRGDSWNRPSGQRPPADNRAETPTTATPSTRPSKDEINQSLARLAGLLEEEKKEGEE